MEKQLRILIENSIGNREQNEIIEIIQNLCNQLMLQTNGLLQQNLYNWNDLKLKDYSDRIQYFSSIISAIMSIKRNQYDYNLIQQAYENSNQLFIAVINEFSEEFNSTYEVRKRQIVEEIYLSHYIFKWYFSKINTNAR